MSKNDDIKKLINDCIFYGMTNFRGGIVPNSNISDNDKMIELFKQYKKMLHYYNDLIKVTNKKTKKYNTYLSKIDKIGMYLNLLDDFIIRV